MRRVLVLGPGCSGKSTFSVLMSEKTGLPVHHLDKYFFNENWQPKETNVWLEDQEKLLTQDNWIIEGGFMKTLPLRAQYSDTIIVLDLPKYITIPRWFGRIRKYKGRTRPDVAPGNIESFNWSYFLWQLKYNRRSIRQKITSNKGSNNLIFLSSRSDIAQFLNSLDTSSR